MPMVRIEPSGLDLDVSEGETIMAAAHRAGYRWPTICGGDGQCAVCFVEVLGQAENLTPISNAERRSLAAFSGSRFYKDVRLACQAKVLGEVTVRKRGVRPVSE